MSNPIRMWKAAALAFAATLVCAFGSPVVRADQPAKILVAQPQLQDPVFGEAVLFVKPMPDGTAVGFIINKPTRITLGQLFPDDKPSQNVTGPVFLGGPSDINVIVAVVEGETSPGEGSIQLAPNLFLALNNKTIDQIIASNPGNARFYAGLVVWQPGQLTDELVRGYWYEMEPDAQLPFRKETDDLWERLAGQSKISKGAI